MKNFKTILLVPFTLLSVDILAQENVRFYIRHNDLYLLNRDENRSYMVRDISTKSSFVLHFPNKKQKGDGEKKDSKGSNPNAEPDKTPSPKDQTDVKDKSLITKLLIESRDRYQKGQLKEALDAVLAAEEIDPMDSRVKKMKGSLYYEMGDIEHAQMYWNESLKINPKQDDVIRALKKTKEGVTP